MIAGSRLFWLSLRAALTDAALALVAVEVVTLIAWAADGKSRSAAASAVRLGACFWLAALHTRVHVGAAVVGIPPLGLTLAICWLAARSAAQLGRDVARSRSTGRQFGLELLPVVGALAVCNGVIAAAVAAAVDTPTLHPSPLTAALGGAVVGGAGAVWGLLRLRRKSGRGTLRSMLPEPVQIAVSAGSTALVALSVVGAVLSGALLLAHHALAGDLNHALSPGPVGTVALGILQLAVSPLLVVGAVSWLAGPGFAVGAGTSVTPWATHLGPVPAVPLLAALPSGSPHLGSAVLVIPVVIGVLTGVIVLRRYGTTIWWHSYAIAAGAAAFAGLVACLGAYLAGGPAGPGRLRTLGPSGWQVGLALGGELVLGAAVAIAVEKAWATRAVSAAAISAAARATGAAAHATGSKAASLRRSPAPTE